MSCSGIWRCCHDVYKLAEKIETILSRNVTNTRGRDFYDVFILLTINRDTLSRTELRHAIHVKSEERGSVPDVNNYMKHLRDIEISPEINKIWAAYIRNYPYANGVTLPNILSLIAWMYSEFAQQLYFHAHSPQPLFRNGCGLV